MLGGVLSLLLTGWIAIGGYIQGTHTKPLEMPVESCPRFMNRTTTGGYFHKGCIVLVFLVHCHLRSFVACAQQSLELALVTGTGYQTQNILPLWRE